MFQPSIVPAKIYILSFAHISLKLNMSLIQNRAPLWGGGGGAQFGNSWPISISVSGGGAKGDRYLIYCASSYAYAQVYSIIAAQTFFVVLLALVYE
jgi:hypothetical protein